MPRLKKYYSPDQLARSRQQLDFVLAHREKIPNLVKSVVQKINCSPSSVYNTLSGMQYSPQVIEALYLVTTQTLGTADAVGEQEGIIGITTANTHDRKILEQLIATQDAERDLIARKAGFGIALREYENAHIRAELAKTALRTLYQVSAPKLSPETITMIAEALASDIASFAIPENPLVEIPLRRREEVVASALSTGPIETPGIVIHADNQDVWLAPKPQYEPVPIVPPEPGNTNEDYERYMAERATKLANPAPRKKQLTAEEIAAKYETAEEESDDEEAPERKKRAKGATTIEEKRALLLREEQEQEELRARVLSRHGIGEKPENTAGD